MICIIIVGLLIIFIPIYSPIINTHLSTQFHIINFTTIKIGDGINEVNNKLKEPLTKYEDGNGKFRLIYSKPKNIYKNYFLFALRFDSADRVVEKYFGIPD